MAHTIKDHLRRSDTVARLGGDEFAVLLPETDYNAAQTVLKKIYDVICDVMKKNKWPVTPSIGALTYHTAPATVDEMVNRADSLMYDVKQKYKNDIRHELADGSVEPQL